MWNPPSRSRPEPRARAFAVLVVGAFFSMLAALAMGCAPLPAEELGVAVQAALNPNALNPNALNPNALSPGALDPDALSPQAVSALQDPSPAGDLSRELLLYTVSCAFTVDQSFAFTWTDAAGTAHAESYPGLLGLAPAWAVQPLDTPGQQWVSDCLASRVNAKGVSVMLSSRGTAPALGTTAAERTAYQTREAVFFGNLFAAPYKVYACYDLLSVLPSQMMNRVCAEPAILDLDLGILTLGYDCGPIEVIGPCAQPLALLTLAICADQDPVARYLYGCAPRGGSTIPSITTFLQGSIPW